MQSGHVDSKLEVVIDIDQLTRSNQLESSMVDSDMPDLEANMLAVGWNHRCW